MLNPKSLDPPAFRIKRNSSNIFSSMLEYKSKSTFRRRYAVRHSKCRRSKSADFSHLSTLIGPLGELWFRVLVHYQSDEGAAHNG
jgi:hypothetical protein